MKKLFETVKSKAKRMCLSAVVAAQTFMLSTVTVLADEKSSDAASPDFKTVYEPIIKLINSLTVPALLIVGALGTLYCILLGVKYAKAEEPQDREKAKSHLKNAIIGFVLIFVLIAALAAATPILANYAGIELTK